MPNELFDMLVELSPVYNIFYVHCSTEYTTGRLQMVLEPAVMFN